MIAFIGMYAGVPAFAEMVDYAVSSRNDDKVSAAEPPKNTIVEPVEVVTDEVSDEDAETELPSWEPVAEDYIAPPIEEQNIPDEVAKKSDLDPIQEYTTTVSDERADEIETMLGTGPTGDDLAFDPLFYPYYEMIGETPKRLYRQIYANVAEKNTAFRAVEKNVYQYCSVPPGKVAVDDLYFFESDLRDNGITRITNAEFKLDVYKDWWDSDTATPISLHFG